MSSHRNAFAVIGDASEHSGGSDAERVTLLNGLSAHCERA